MKFLNIFFLIIFFTLTGCNSKQNENALIVGVSADNPPYEFLKDNQLIGLEIDIINEIGKKLNKEIIFKNLEFNGLLAALESKNIDLIIAGLSVTEARKAKVSFSTPYITTSIAVLYRCSDLFTKKEDLKDKTVGYQLGSVWGDVVNSLIPTLNIKPHSLSNNLMLVEELKSKTIDAVVLEEAQAKKFVINNKDFNYFVLDKTYSQEFAIATNLNSALITDINNAIKSLEEEGKLKMIMQKWLEQ